MHTREQSCCFGGLPKIDSFLHYVEKNDVPKVRWAMRTFQRIADATGLDLSRHMDGYELLGKDMKLGTSQQRQLIDRVKEERKRPDI